jgi:hypothetical protein
MTVGGALAGRDCWWCVGLVMAGCSAAAEPRSAAGSGAPHRGVVSTASASAAFGAGPMVPCSHDSAGPHRPMTTTSLSWTRSPCPPESWLLSSRTAWLAVRHAGARRPRRRRGRYHDRTVGRYQGPDRLGQSRSRRNEHPRTGVPEQQRLAGLRRWLRGAEPAVYTAGSPGASAATARLRRGRRRLLMPTWTCCATIRSGRMAPRRPTVPIRVRGGSENRRAGPRPKSTAKASATTCRRSLVPRHGSSGWSWGRRLAVTGRASLIDGLP